MIELLVYLVVAAIVCGFIAWAYAQIGLPYANIVQAFCGVIFIIVVIYALVGLVGGGPPLLHRHI